jgi:nitrogenase molybdenum-iron protein alpha/beta subunit
MTDSPESDDALLEHHGLKPSYGRLTGVSVGLHAIRDGYLLMHVGVGCKNKVTHLLNHDWELACNLRQGWTEVGDRDLIVGATARVGPYLRAWSERMDSGFVGVVSVTFLELAGEDIADEVVQIDAEMDVPVALIPALGFDGDEFDGYAAVCHAVLKALPWGQRPVKRRQVSLLGYWFDRYEGDHQGNLNQLARLVKGLGLELGPTVLGGTPFSDLEGAVQSHTLVALPHLQPVRKKLRRLWRKAGREPIWTDLPMGIAGTSRWLRDVGRAAGVDPNRVEALIQLREQRARAPLRKMGSRWQGRRVAVFAEVPMAVGLCSILTELGFTVGLVGLRGTSLGTADDFRAALACNGIELPAALVRDSPSLGRIRQDLTDLLHGDGLDGILGTATELSVLAKLEPTGRGAGPFRLEFGFPCREYHALMQMPFLGYAGVAALAQRLVSAPRLWDTADPGTSEQR